MEEKASELGSPDLLRTGLGKPFLRYIAGEFERHSGRTGEQESYLGSRQLFTVGSKALA